MWKIQIFFQCARARSQRFPFFVDLFFDIQKLTLANHITFVPINGDIYRLYRILLLRTTL